MITNIRPVESWEDFKAAFEKSVHAKLDEVLSRDGVTGIVMFENRALDSSQRGARTAVIVGPGCTYKSVDDCQGRWLNDLPSQRQYPTACYLKPEVSSG